MGGGGSDNSFSERQDAEEARKTALRSKINRMYGYDAVDAAPTKKKFQTTPDVISSDDAGNVRQTPGMVDDDAFARAVEDYNKSGAEAQVARDAMAKEEAELSAANRAFYSEDLKHSYDRAERNNRFALADRGLLGGSAQVDTEAELNRDNTLGATRLEDEVRNSISSLRGQREGERLNAMNLVNSGAGSDAVAGAQAGLSRALQNAAATRKASITSDLFAGGADSVAAGNDAGTNALALQRYQNQLKTFFGTSGGNTGRVTAT